MSQKLALDVNLKKLGSSHVSVVMEGIHALNSLMLSTSPLPIKKFRQNGNLSGLEKAEIIDQFRFLMILDPKSNSDMMVNDILKIDENNLLVSSLVLKYWSGWVKYQVWDLPTYFQNCIQLLSGYTTLPIDSFPLAKDLIVMLIDSIQAELVSMVKSICNTRNTSSTIQSLSSFLPANWASYHPFVKIGVLCLESDGLSSFALDLLILKFGEIIEDEVLNWEDPELVEAFWGVNISFLTWILDNEIFDTILPSIFATVLPNYSHSSLGSSLVYYPYTIISLLHHFQQLSSSQGHLSHTLLKCIATFLTHNYLHLVSNSDNYLGFYEKIHGYICSKLMDSVFNSKMNQPGQPTLPILKLTVKLRSINDATINPSLWLITLAYTLFTSHSLPELQLVLAELSKLLDSPPFLTSTPSSSAQLINLKSFCLYPLLTLCFQFKHLPDILKPAQEIILNHFEPLPLFDPTIGLEFFSLILATVCDDVTGLKLYPVPGPKLTDIIVVLRNVFEARDLFKNSIIEEGSNDFKVGLFCIMPMTLHLSESIRKSWLNYIICKVDLTHHAIDLYHYISYLLNSPTLSAGYKSYLLYLAIPDLITTNDAYTATSGLTLSKSIIQPSSGPNDSVAMAMSLKLLTSMYYKYPRLWPHLRYYLIEHLRSFKLKLRHTHVNVDKDELFILLIITLTELSRTKPDLFFKDIYPLIISIIKFQSTLPTPILTNLLAIINHCLPPESQPILTVWNLIYQPLMEKHTIENTPQPLFEQLMTFVMLLVTTLPEKSDLDQTHPHILLKESLLSDFIAPCVKVQIEDLHYSTNNMCSVLKVLAKYESIQIQQTLLMPPWELLSFLQANLPSNPVDNKENGYEHLLLKLISEEMILLSRAQILGTRTDAIDQLSRNHDNAKVEQLKFQDRINQLSMDLVSRIESQTEPGMTNCNLLTRALLGCDKGLENSKRLMRNMLSNVGYHEDWLMLQRLPEIWVSFFNTLLTTSSDGGSEDSLTTSKSSKLDMGLVKLLYSDLVQTFTTTQLPNQKANCLFALSSLILSLHSLGYANSALTYYQQLVQLLLGYISAIGSSEVNEEVKIAIIIAMTQTITLDLEDKSTVIWFISIAQNWLDGFDLNKNSELVYHCLIEFFVLLVDGLILFSCNRVNNSESGFEKEDFDPLTAVGLILSTLAPKLTTTSDSKRKEPYLIKQANLGGYIKLRVTGFIYNDLYPQVGKLKDDLFNENLIDVIVRLVDRWDVALEQKSNDYDELLSLSYCFTLLAPVISTVLKDKPNQVEYDELVLALYQQTLNVLSNTRHPYKYVAKFCHNTYLHCRYSINPTVKLNTSYRKKLNQAVEESVEELDDLLGLIAIIGMGTIGLQSGVPAQLFNVDPSSKEIFERAVQLVDTTSKKRSAPLEMKRLAQLTLACISKFNSTPHMNPSILTTWLQVNYPDMYHSHNELRLVVEPANYNRFNLQTSYLRACWSFLTNPEGSNSLEMKLVILESFIKLREFPLPPVNWFELLKDMINSVNQDHQLNLILEFVSIHFRTSQSLLEVLLYCYNQLGHLLINHSRSALAPLFTLKTMATLSNLIGYDLPEEISEDNGLQGSYRKLLKKSSLKVNTFTKNIVQLIQFTTKEDGDKAFLLQVATNLNAIMRHSQYQSSEEEDVVKQELNQTTAIISRIIKAHLADSDYLNILLAMPNRRELLTQLARLSGFNINIKQPLLVVDGEDEWVLSPIVVVYSLKCLHLYSNDRDGVKDGVLSILKVLLSLDSDARELEVIRAAAQLIQLLSPPNTNHLVNWLIRLLNLVLLTIDTPNSSTILQQHTSNISTVLINFTNLITLILINNQEMYDINQTDRIQAVYNLTTILKDEGLKAMVTSRIEQVYLIIERVDFTNAGDNTRQFEEGSFILRLYRQMLN